MHYHTVRKLFSAFMLLADRTSGGSDTSPEPFPPAVFFWKKVEEEYRRENWVIPGTRRTRPIKRRLVINYYYIVTSVQSNLAKDCVAMPLPVGGDLDPHPTYGSLGPHESASQIGCRSVHPFMHDTSGHMTRNVGGDRPHTVRTDSTDSPDCLPILLSISFFHFLVFLFSTF